MAMIALAGWVLVAAIASFVGFIVCAVLDSRRGGRSRFAPAAYTFAALAVVGSLSAQFIATLWRFG